MEKSSQPIIRYRLNIELLQIVEERVSARLASGAPIDPAALADEIINDALSKGFSWQEIIEVVEVTAEELNVPIVRPLKGVSR
jgi:hypothetical protein